MATRDGLIACVDAYLDALGANEPARAPFAADARYTENCQELPLGKGIWATATPYKPESHYVDIVEPEVGQIAYFGLAHEAGKPSLLSLRLRVADDRIVEAEALVCRDPGQTGSPRVFNPEAMVDPKPLYAEIVAPDERSPREELVRIANLYLDGILAADGGMIPVRPDCIRIENGVQTVLNPERGTETAKLGVADQINTGIFRDIEDARDRRFPVVDTERGLVFGIFLFDHPGPVTASGGRSRYSQPNSMMVAELFKIRNGEIVQIEAVLNVFPYGTKPGWS